MKVFIAGGQSDGFFLVGGERAGQSVHAGAAVTNAVFAALKAQPGLPFNALQVVLEFSEISDAIGLFRATVYLDDEWEKEQRAKNQAREDRLWVEREEKRRLTRMRRRA